VRQEDVQVSSAVETALNRHVSALGTAFGFFSPELVGRAIPAIRTPRARFHNSRRCMWSIMAKVWGRAIG
jgi:hypothetical protein